MQSPGQKSSDDITPGEPRCVTWGFDRSTNRVEIARPHFERTKDRELKGAN